MPTQTNNSVKPASVADTLRAARALIEDPKRWTRGALAKPHKWAPWDYAVAPNSSEAGAWCAVGAIKRIDGPHEEDALIMLATAVVGNGNSYEGGPKYAADCIVDFNDARVRRHKQVLAVFDKAIALAEQPR